jgi:HD superfamily phosphohydrolase
MYRSVYWHKTVRIATAMIKKAVLLGLEQGVLSASELYWLDDQEFYTRTLERGFAPFQLIPRVAERRLYKQIATIAFREDNAFQTSLRDLGTRLELESQVAAEASRLSGTAVPAHAVIIDIPEPIRFEIDVPVLLQEEGRTASYRESGSVFTPQIVRGFSGALRRISLIADVDPGLQGALARIGPARILEAGL